jgi:5'-3' exonuclease
MAAAVCQFKKQPANYLGAFLFSLEYLDNGTIVHESVHMAKKYLRKIHRLQDEELLCDIAGYIANLTINARPMLRRLYAKT